MKYFLIAALVFLSSLSKGQVLDSLQIEKLLQGKWGVENKCEFIVKGDSVHYPQYTDILFTKPAKHYKFKISKIPYNPVYTVSGGTGFYLIETSANETTFYAIDYIDGNRVELNFEKDEIFSYYKIQ